MFGYIIRMSSGHLPRKGFPGTPSWGDPVEYPEHTGEITSRLEPSWYSTGRAARDG